MNRTRKSKTKDKGGLFESEETRERNTAEADNYTSYFKSGSGSTTEEYCIEECETSSDYVSFQTIAEQDTDVEFKEKVSKLTEEMMEREGAVATEMEICETELGARNIIGNVSSEARETTEEVAIIAANLEQKFESEVEIIEADSQNAIEDDVEINEVQQKVAVEIEIEEETDEKESVKLEDETEMVSEDELPSEGDKRVLDTEAVSDEELPTISAGDIPDTEQVSDDELPPVAKRKRKHSSRHSSDSDQKSDSSGKKSKQEKEKSRRSPSRGGEGDSGSLERRSPDSKGVKPPPKSKLLPELEKYWKAVKDDPTDFTGWTYLLQYVDQESDLEAAREAYDTFLSHYPYCYGYWRKYADYEKRKGEKSKCEEVFERGLTAIPLSVDLWLHYLNFCKVNLKDDEEQLRTQFKRAIEQCGLEFRSDRLWDSYIKWEAEGKHLQNVSQIYDQLLRVPTQGYKTHFENFEEFVRNNPPNKILSVDEFLTIRAEVLQKLKQKKVPIEPSAAPPGDESGDDDETNQVHADEETTQVREKIITSRKKIFKDTITAVIARWNFEEGIKRPYFHVKPLERVQLNTWREYIDFEIAGGEEQRIVILFERCLIACALYEEFWVKYIKYLESLPRDMEDKIRNVYERACLIHHTKKPYLALNWATFEESHGNVEGARKILCHIDKEVPGVLIIQLRKINLERRAGNLTEASRLYEHYISLAKTKIAFVTLSVKYARFCMKILHDNEKAISVVKKALEEDKGNIRLNLQLLDLLMNKTEFVEDECVAIFNQIIEKDSVDIEHKIKFAQRKIEFIEDYGKNIKSIKKAKQDYFAILKQLKERKKHLHKTQEDKKSDDGKTKVKVDGNHVAGNSQPASANSGNSTYSNSNYSSNYSSNQGYSSGSGSQYGQTTAGQYSTSEAGYSGYQNWSYSQPGYGNYNQGWGGYNYYS
ncbi:pre-mRNA processing factor 39 [Rhodnius prolixus]